MDTLLGPEETDLWDCDRIPTTRAMRSPLRASPLALGWRDGAPAMPVLGTVGSPAVCGTSCRAILLPYRFNPLGVGCQVAWWVGCCLLFEICIVDASIFVAKFFRAHGGCLGIRSR